MKAQIDKDGFCKLLDEPFATVTCYSKSDYDKLKNSLKVEEKMAKYIMRSGADYCCDCCLVRKECEERLQGDENKLPPKDYCVKQIIRFFENEASKEQSD